MLNFAEWVYTSSIEGNLPWDKASIRNLEDFKSKYTIHDSCWGGLFMDLNLHNEATLVIQWDSVWLPNEIAESTLYVEDWPYLFIKIEGVEQISTWGYGDMKDVGRSLGKLEYEAIDDKGVCAINDVYGGKLQIVFTGKVSILAIDKNKRLLNI